MKVANRCDFYSEGFFGYGLKGDFTYWSFWHFLPIIILLILIFLICVLVKPKVYNKVWLKSVITISSFKTM